jgi:hypothetical protein
MDQPNSNDIPNSYLIDFSIFASFSALKVMTELRFPYDKEEQKKFYQHIIGTWAKHHKIAIAKQVNKMHNSEDPDLRAFVDQFNMDIEDVHVQNVKVVDLAAKRIGELIKLASDVDVNDNGSATT